jgi:hypothetical protein
MRLRKIKRNEARLAELGLLVPLAPRSKTNRRKSVVMQDDVGRRVQSKRNVSTPSSYKDLDDHVINKRTFPVDSPNVGEEGIKGNLVLR